MAGWQALALSYGHHLIFSLMYLTINFRLIFLSESWYHFTLDTRQMKFGKQSYKADPAWLQSFRFLWFRIGMSSYPVS